MHFLLLLAAPLLVAAQNSGSSATCFFPAGNVADNNVPCNPNAAVSQCCAKASQCLDNGLCKVNNDDDTVEFARGACTDQTWNSPECFQHCKTSQPGSPDTNGAAVFECGTVGFLNLATYCCENGIDRKTACCSTSSLLFQLGPGSSTTYSSMSTPTSLPVTTSTALPVTGTTTTVATSEPIDTTSALTVSAPIDTTSIAATGTESATSIPLGTGTSSPPFSTDNNNSSFTPSSTSITPPIQTAAAAGGRTGMACIGTAVGMGVMVMGMGLM